MQSSAKEYGWQGGCRSSGICVLPVRYARASPVDPCGGPQVCQAQQVERPTPDVSHLLYLRVAHVPHFAQTTRLFRLHEQLFNFLSHSLTEHLSLGLHSPPRLGGGALAGYMLGGDGHLWRDRDMSSSGVLKNLPASYPRSALRVFGFTPFRNSTPRTRRSTFVRAQAHLRLQTASFAALCQR